MGLVISKKSQPPAKNTERRLFINSVPIVEYSLTFSGEIYNTITRKKGRLISSDFAEGLISENEFWFSFIQEIMSESLVSIFQKTTGEEYYSRRYPTISEISVVLGKKENKKPNTISGTLYWKSIGTDVKVLGDIIAKKFADESFGNIVDINNTNRVYVFIPGFLRV